MTAIIMEINDEIQNCKSSLNDMFDAISNVFLHLSRMLNKNKALVLIQQSYIPDAGASVEYWILRDYTIKNVTPATGTAPNFTVECTITGQGIHGIALRDSETGPREVLIFIRLAAEDAAEGNTDSESWTSRLISKSIFIETGSLRTDDHSKENGALKTNFAIGLNAAKFDDKTVYMDEIDKSLLDRFMQYTDGYSVISH